MTQGANRRAQFAPACQGNLFGSSDKLGLDDDRSVRASMNMQDRVSVGVFTARGTVGIALVVSI